MISEKSTSRIEAAGSSAVGAPLVVRFGALGDMVMLTALTDLLAERWGSPCDLVISGRTSPAVFEGLESVGTVFVVRSRRMPYLLEPSQHRLVRWLGARPAGPVYLLDAEQKVQWLFDRAKVPADHRCSALDVPRADLEHGIDYALRLGRAEPAALASREPRRLPPQAERLPRLVVSETEKEDCRRWLERLGLDRAPLVLLQLHSRRRRRGRWPTSRWRAVIREVLERQPEGRVLLLGAPAESPVNRSLVNELGDPRVLDIAAELPLRRLFALCRLAHSAISIDTGPAHVAAALGCPLVVLSGRADPRRNAPRGPAPVRVATGYDGLEWPSTRHDWESNHDLMEIGVDRVIEAWEAVCAAVDGSDRAER